MKDERPLLKSLTHHLLKCPLIGEKLEVFPGDSTEEFLLFALDVFNALLIALSWLKTLHISFNRRVNYLSNSSLTDVQKVSNFLVSCVAL